MSLWHRAGIRVFFPTSIDYIENWDSTGSLFSSKERYNFIKSYIMQLYSADATVFFTVKTNKHKNKLSQKLRSDKIESRLVRCILVFFGREKQKSKRKNPFVHFLGESADGFIWPLPYLWQFEFLFSTVQTAPKQPRIESSYVLWPAK